jgi:glycosyltransferase involved in cell wall biosynthesis
VVDPEVASEELRDLRVLHVQKTHGMGGSERHIVDLCAGLRACGADARILWLTSTPTLSETLADLGNRRGVPATARRMRAAFDPGLCGTIRATLRAWAPQVLHLHLIHATLYGVLAALGTPARIVATRHSTERYQRLPWFQLLARLLDARTARVIAPSHWVARYTRRWDGTPGAKLRVIPHGIDPQPYASLPARSDSATCTVTAIARLHPSKDHTTLIEAFAIIAKRHPQARLQIAGGGPLRERLERRVERRLGAAVAEGRVRFLGERGEIAEVLAGADIVVLPGAREGFGLAALEAMAAGRSVIAPGSGALPELIEDRVNGLLVPPGDPAALAAAIDRLARDPRERHVLGQRARKAAARFTIARMVTETARLYREVAGPASRGRGAIDRSGGRS